LTAGAAAEPLPISIGKADGYTPAEATPAAVSAGRVPLEEIPSEFRPNVSRVLDQPTLSASGTPEEFTGRPGLYEWLLQHPDRAAQAWRRLGAPCLEIVDRGGGVFGCSDARGSEVHWQTIYQTAGVKIWYAEGRARPSLLLPPIVLHAVAILQHDVRHDASGKTVIRQQARIYLHTDSRTANWLLHMLGPTAPRLMDECVAQLQLFYSSLVRYADKYPDRTDWLLFGPRQPEPAGGNKKSG
jgi:hypothetical protein